MTGNHRADVELTAERLGMSKSALQRWARTNGVNLHHDPSGRSMQFVRNEYHRLPHNGGGNHLRSTTPLQRTALRGIGGGTRALGAAGMAYGAYQDGKSLYNEFQISQETGDYSNTAIEAGRITAGWSGAALGAQLGARIGMLGFYGGPVVGAVTTVLGGAIGGALGYAAGSGAFSSFFD